MSAGELIELLPTRPALQVEMTAGTQKNVIG